MKYIISGKVIRGDGYGKKIDFPTINLDRKGFLKMERKPVFGVYSGTVILGTKNYKAGIVIGPFDKKDLPKIEAHLIGFEGDVYGKKAEFEIIKFIRKFKKFKTEEELIEQIKKDIKICSQA
jgi:riboflavin kinase/FMN adenylyltransferase